MASHQYKPDNCEASIRDTGDSSVSSATDPILQDNLDSNFSLTTNTSDGNDDSCEIYDEDGYGVTDVQNQFESCHYDFKEKNFKTTAMNSYDSLIDYDDGLHCESGEIFAEDTDFHSSTCTSIDDSYDSNEDDSILPDEDEFCKIQCNNYKNQQDATGDGDPIQLENYENSYNNTNTNRNNNEDPGDATELEDYDDLVRRAYESQPDEVHGGHDGIHNAKLNKNGEMPIIKMFTCSSKGNCFALGLSAQDKEQCTESQKETKEYFPAPDLRSFDQDDSFDLKAKDSTLQQSVAEPSEIHTTENTSLIHNSDYNINELDQLQEDQYPEGDFIVSYTTDFILQDNLDSNFSLTTNTSDAILQENDDSCEISAEDGQGVIDVQDQFMRTSSIEHNYEIHADEVYGLSQSHENQYIEDNWNSTSEDLQNNVESSISF